MGFIKKICVGAAAVVSSALLGYSIYKNYFQSEEVDDETVPGETKENSAGINESQNVKPVVNKVENINSTKGVHEASNLSIHCASSHQKAKTKGKSKTGYMGLRKGFLL